MTGRRTNSPWRVPRSAASPLQRATMDMNLALGTLARAVANLSQALTVFVDTEQGERLRAALKDATEAYDWLTTGDGRLARRRAAHRFADRREGRQGRPDDDQLALEIRSGPENDR